MLASDVITNRVRLVLADNYPDGNAAQRWTDALLIRWLNDGVQIIVNLKPEALLSAAYTLTTITEVTALTDTVGNSTTALDTKYREPLVDYVCGRALAQESQDERDFARARQHFQQFVIKAGLPIKSPVVAEIVPGRRI